MYDENERSKRFIKNGHENCFPKHFYLDYPRLLYKWSSKITYQTKSWWSSKYYLVWFGCFPFDDERFFGFGFGDSWIAIHFVGRKRVHHLTIRIWENNRFRTLQITVRFHWWEVKTILKHFQEISQNKFFWTTFDVDLWWKWKYRIVKIKSI